jgi:predicted phosphodiesterase
MLEVEFDKLRVVNGLLFIGDPHVTSVKPGRRKDKDYAQTMLNKLRFLIDVCNEERYVPVFLGDMFDTAVEKSVSVIVRLQRILLSCWTLPIGNVGNHDIANKYLTDNDTLRILQVGGMIKLCETAGELDAFNIGGKIVAVGATPYGQSFPTDARQYFSKADTIIWLTHHDVAFGDTYPGAVAPQAIKGCKLVVNGHMHLSKPLVPVGSTMWFNPGNINRQKIDAIEHEPCAWAMTAEGKLKKIAIPYEKAIFDLTGQLIDSRSPGEAPVTEEGSIADSAFIVGLEAQTSLEMTKSDDGSIVKEEMVAKFEREKTKPVVMAILLNVLSNAVSGEIR